MYFFFQFHSTLLGRIRSPYPSVRWSQQRLGWGETTSCQIPSEPGAEGGLSPHQSFSWQRKRGYGVPHTRGDAHYPFPALPWGSKTFQRWVEKARTSSGHVGSSSQGCHGSCPCSRGRRGLAGGPEGDVQGRQLNVQLLARRIKRGGVRVCSKPSRIRNGSRTEKYRFEPKSQSKLSQRGCLDSGPSLKINKE